MQLTVFVVIVTYNGMEWIDKCLSSVLNQSIKCIPIVIDNGSSDGTTNHIKKKYPDIYLHRTKKNIGFGQANNLGLRYAIQNNADYVYLLNQDAWLMNDTIETLISIALKHPNFGILSPMQISANRTKLDKNFSFQCGDSNTPSLLSDMYFGELKEVYHTNFVMAAHWLLSNEVIKTIGGFSPIFFLYGEDNNYIDRVQYHGYKVGICPSAKAIHDRSERVEPISRKPYMLYIEFFLTATNNINNPFLKTLRSSIFLLVIHEVRCIIRLKTIRPIKYLFSALLKIPATIKYRRITKQKGSLFLFH